MSPHVEPPQPPYSHYLHLQSSCLKLAREGEEVWGEWLGEEMPGVYRRIPVWSTGKLVQASSSRLAASSALSISSQVSAALCQTLSSLPCLFSAGCHPASALGYGSFILHWNQGQCRCLPALLPPPPTSLDLSKSLDFSKSKFPLYKTQLTKPWC